jgi:hypothetical protein
MKIDNRFFEMLEDFKYLETTLTNQNSIQEETEGICRTFEEKLVIW